MHNNSLELIPLPYSSIKPIKELLASSENNELNLSKEEKLLEETPVVRPLLLPCSFGRLEIVASFLSLCEGCDIHLFTNKKKLKCWKRCVRCQALKGAQKYFSSKMVQVVEDNGCNNNSCLKVLVKGSNSIMVDILKPGREHKHQQLLGHRSSIGGGNKIVNEEWEEIGKIGVGDFLMFKNMDKLHGIIKEEEDISKQDWECFIFLVREVEKNEHELEACSNNPIIETASFGESPSRIQQNIERNVYHQTSESHGKKLHVPLQQHEDQLEGSISLTMLPTQEEDSTKKGPSDASQQQQKEQVEEESMTLTMPMQEESMRSTFNGHYLSMELTQNYQDDKNRKENHLQGHSIEQITKITGGGPNYNEPLSSMSLEDLKTIHAYCAKSGRKFYGALIKAVILRKEANQPLPEIVEGATVSKK